MNASRQSATTLYVTDTSSPAACVIICERITAAITAELNENVVIDPVIDETRVSNAALPPPATR